MEWPQPPEKVPNPIGNSICIRILRDWICVDIPRFVSTASGALVVGGVRDIYMYIVVVVSGDSFDVFL